MNPELDAILRNIANDYKSPEWAVAEEITLADAILDFLDSKTPSKKNKVGKALAPCCRTMLEGECTRLLLAGLVCEYEWFETQEIDAIPPYKPEFLADLIWSAIEGEGDTIRVYLEPNVVYAKVNAIGNAIEYGEVVETDDEWLREVCKIIVAWRRALSTSKEFQQTITPHKVFLALLKRFCTYNELTQEQFDEIAIHLYCAAFFSKAESQNDACLYQVLHTKPNGIFLADIVTSVLQALPHYEGNPDTRTYEDM